MKKTALNHLYTSLMLLLVAVVLNQCGTSKNTPITRTYHNLTSYYNILFNGRESFEKGLRQYRNDYQYDFTRILPVHIHGNSKLAKSIRPQMERTIEKCSKLIRLHSITAKPEKLEKKGKLTQEEKAYYNKNEFNKYVDDSYLLMGRAYYWEMEYQTASKVLEYAAREFKNEQVRDRANIWRSRCYIEIGNYNEAQKVLSGLKDREPDPQVKPAFYATYADLHIRQDQYSQALPYLKKSVKHQPDNTIRERHAFIIAQLYEEMEQPEKAFDQYQKVIAMNPDYRLEFNAMLKKAWLHHLTNRGGEKMKEQLKKMLHDSKNEEYRDQIYYALGQIAQHSNGLLSRLKPTHIEEHRLPGTLPGRGAIHARFGEGPDALHIFVAHLALSHRGRTRQLNYLSDLITPLRHVVVMGDLNCTPQQIHAHARFSESLPLHPVKPLLSYPSWQPRHALDHILLSRSLEAAEVQVLDHLFSDHLPLAVDLPLPTECLASLKASCSVSV